VVVSAANSAARKRSRPSSSTARDSRVLDQPADGAQEAAMSEDTAQEQRSGATSRAAKAREELAAVPSQDLPGDLAVVDDLDADADLDGEDLEAVDLEDFEDLDDDDLGDEVLVAEDLEIVDVPEVDLAEADLADQQELVDRQVGGEDRPGPAGLQLRQPAHGIVRNARGIEFGRDVPLIGHGLS